MRVAARNVLAVAGFLIIALIWLPRGNNLLTALGILGAGLAIASQEMVGSLVAGLNIWLGNIYRVGDRVRIGILIVSSLAALSLLVSSLAA